MLNKVYILKKLKEVELYEKEIDKRLERLNELVEMKIQKFKRMNFQSTGNHQNKKFPSSFCSFAPKLLISSLRKLRKGPYKDFAA